MPDEARYHRKRLRKPLTFLHAFIIIHGGGHSKRRRRARFQPPKVLLVADLREWIRHKRTSLNFNSINAITVKLNNYVRARKN